MLQVCETYPSIQGESTWAGWPCFFIRLSGCNLRCSYCDTVYAYADGEACSISQLLEEFRSSNLKLVEVTGGEPLLQPEVIELLHALKQYGTVLLETNGSQDISRVPESVVIIMDIKCPGSNESKSIDWQNIQRLRITDEVKFVIGGRSDYVWARDVVLKNHLADRCHAVLFSPVSGVLEPAWLANWLIADRLSVRLNLQLHKLFRERISRRERYENSLM